MLHLLLLLCLLATCSCSIRSAPRYTADSSVAHELEKRRRASPSRLARVVEGYLGVPYKWGGKTRAGMDCSAFVRTIFRQTYGIELPLTAKQIYRVGRTINQRQDLKPGDLVFFRNTFSGQGVSHVGIYLGKKRFAHVGVSTGATITSLDHPYFLPRYVGARRVER
ncbi:MAG: C40 family peptidase [Gemmatimonadetes bacterium]|nr:C40 family peptidase [Gemmatimonadota bacterium]